MKSLLFFIVLYSALFSDTTLKFKSGAQDALKFYYGDDTHMRLTMYDSEGNSDLYVIGKKSYIVSYDNGHVEIVDMDQMRAMMGVFGAAVQAEAVTPFVEVLKRGGSVKVAGVHGEKWTVRIRDDEGSERANVVVTNNSDIVHTMRALSSTLSFIPNDGEGSLISFFEIEKGYVMIKHPELLLTSYSKADIDDSVFLLPNSREKVKKHKAAPKKKTITKQRRVKKCKRFQAADNDGSSGSMKYGSPKCVEWYYEVETYEVEVEEEPKPSSGFHDNEDDDAPLGSDHPLGGFKGFF